MYSVKKSIDIDFAHHVGGHDGACINLHGHTWKFEVEIEAEELNSMGFVVDFKDLKNMVLEPVHRLLDHSLALHESTYSEIQDSLKVIGGVLQSTRKVPALHGETSEKVLGYKHLHDTYLNGAANFLPGGIKIAVFSFSPTSERLAEWLYCVAELAFGKYDRVHVVAARVYETLHPVEAVAEYRRSGGLNLS